MNGLQVFFVNNSTTIPGTVSSFTVASFKATFNLTNASACVYNLTVTNPGDLNATKVRAFSVRIPGLSPTISMINPASGINAGNLPVTITERTLEPRPCISARER